MNLKGFSPTEREALYGQADFRLFVPYQPGQRALVFGDALELAESLADWGVETTLVSSKLSQNIHKPNIEIIPASWPLSIASESCEHVLIPEMLVSYPGGCLDEAARLLKPGGWLFLGVENRQSLEQFIKTILGKNKRRAANSRGTLKRLSLDGAKKILSAHGFAVVRVVGVASNLQKPGLYIPLDAPEIIRDFYITMHSPYSWKDRIMYGVARLFVGIRLQRALFTHFILVAKYTALSDSQHAR